jgi:3-methyladenine DNA glycosylase AlkD
VRTLVDDIVAAVGRTGGTVPELRELRKAYSQKLTGSQAVAVLDIARRLIQRGGDGVRLVAYELVQSHPAAANALREESVVALGEGMDSWGAVDAFAAAISGPAWKRGQISDRAIASWARSDDRWWRRAALASTIALNRRPAADKHAERTLAICAMLVDDRDDMVVKALSWALRELSKADRAAAEAFVAAHEDALAPRVKREVANKLRTGLKTPRR